MNRFFLWAFLLATTGTVNAQSAPASDPQAVAIAAQSMAALTGGVAVSDVTLTGSVTWNGSDSGIATLVALGTGESRMDLALSGGTRTEIRDGQTGTPEGQWFAPNSISGYVALQNCWTDPAWFFPALGSLSGGPNVVFSYVGQEVHNNQPVQHIQTSVYQSSQFSSATPQQLSRMDFYLDVTSSLPAAVAFYVHPDDDAGTNLSVEVDFSNYQTMNGVAVPMRIQKYHQGNLMVDVVVTAATFNTGVALSTFTIN